MASILSNIALGLVGGYALGLLVTLVGGEPRRWRQDRVYHLSMAVLFAIIGGIDATLRVVV